MGVVSIFYPLLQTLDALESNDPVLLKAWFSYWVVVAVVWVLDRYHNLQYNLPHVCFGKICFYVCLYHPSTSWAP
jgi:hypothetical protein